MSKCCELITFYMYTDKQSLKQGRSLGEDFAKLRGDNFTKFGRHCI